MSERVQLAILALLALIIVVVGVSMIPGAKELGDPAGRVLDLLASGLIGALGGYAVRAMRDGGDG
jgi:hypothetical protein